MQNPGVVAILTSPQGRVLETVTDFEMAGAGGYTLLEAQAHRAKRMLAAKVIDNFCPDWIAKALNPYKCSEILNHMTTQQGFTVTVVPIGHESDAS